MNITSNFFEVNDTLIALAHHSFHLETNVNKTLYLGRISTVIRLASISKSDTLNDCFDMAGTPHSFPSLPYKHGLVALLIHDKGIEVFAMYTLRQMKVFFKKAHQNNFSIQWRILECSQESKGMIQKILMKDQESSDPLSLKKGFFLSR